MSVLTVALFSYLGHFIYALKRAGLEIIVLTDGDRVSEILIYQALHSQSVSVGEQVKKALLLAATRRQKHHTWCYKFVC